MQLQETGVLFPPRQVGGCFYGVAMPTIILPCKGPLTARAVVNEMQEIFDIDLQSLPHREAKDQPSAEGSCAIASGYSTGIWEARQRLGI